MAFFRKWKAHYKHKKFTSEDGVEANELNFDGMMNNKSLSNSKHNVHAIIPDDEEDNKPLFASYEIKYMGCTPIESKRSEKSTSDAIKTVIANSKAGGRKAKSLKRVVLNVTQDYVEVLDQQTMDKLMTFSIYQISYCSVDNAHDHVFSFVSSETNPLSEKEQLSCHVFHCPKRKVAHEITLMVAKCFENAYQLWRDTVVQHAKTQNHTHDKLHSGKVLKEQNHFDSKKVIESQAEVHEPHQHHHNHHPDTPNHPADRKVDNLLIDFAVTNNGGNNLQTFQTNNWVSFEEDFRDHDKHQIAAF